MLPTWLLQSLASRLVSYLLVLGGGIVIAWLKKKKAEWAGPALYGIAGSAFIALIIYVVLSLPALTKASPTPITFDNIEASLRTWLDEFNVTVTKVEDQSTYFRLDIVTFDRHTLIIERPKGRSKYLTLALIVAIPQDRKTSFNQLSKNMQNEVKEEINLEMAQTKLGFNDQLPEAVTVVYALPITETLTEDNVLNTISNMDAAAVVAQNAFEINVNRALAKK